MDSVGNNPDSNDAPVGQITSRLLRIYDSWRESR